MLIIILYPSEIYANDYQSGIAIFSKYPMIDSANFSFNENNRGEHLLYTDIKVKIKFSEFSLPIYNLCILMKRIIKV